MAIRKAFLHLTALFSLGLLGACASGFSATYDSDPSQDFSGYQTFAWISKNPMIVGQTNRMPNPLLEPRIMAAMESVLGAKGYRKVEDPETADFALSFTIGSREEIKVNSYPASYASYGVGGAWGWGGPYYGMGMATETQVRQYQKGMLALDIFDVKERRPVFHAVAEKSITESDRKKLDQTVQAAVNAVLQGFPPQPE
jgi:hypothetical protein